MRLEQFIASRLSGSPSEKSFSRTIIRIATASIALSVVVMIVATATIRGFKKEISQKIFDFWGHIQITQAFTNPILEGIPMQTKEGLVDSILDVGQIYYEWPIYLFGKPTDRFRTRRTSGGVKSAYSYIQYPAVLTTRSDMEGLVFKGLADDFGSRFFERYLVSGHVLNKSEKDEDGNEILISQTTATRLELNPGDQVLLYFIKDGRPKPRRFSIGGIYKTGLAEYDKKLGFMAISDMQNILGWSENDVTGIEVVVENIDDLHILNEYINQEVLPSHLYTRSIRQVSSSIFDWLDLQDTNEVLILGLMLLVCIINMITALLILILERTQMIGTLKAMGATNWQVRKIFLRQAGRILGFGLLIGNAIGILLCLFQRKFQFIRLREEDYYLNVAPIDLDITIILLINIGTFILTIVILVLPSYFISRISPTKSLRFN